MRDFDSPEAEALLGGWIARWRARVGVSQRTLARRAGIDQGGLSRVERGLQLVGPRRLARILATLDDLGARGPMGPLPPPSFRPPPTWVADPAAADVDPWEVAPTAPAAGRPIAPAAGRPIAPAAPTAPAAGPGADPPRRR